MEMINIEELRRLAVDCNWPTSPVAINTILDRLEAAESEAIEEARLNGMGSEREAALMAKLESAEKERDAAELMSLALRAKVNEMERQEPVAKVESWTNSSYTRYYKLKWLRDVDEGALLYALPGAEPEAKP